MKKFIVGAVMLHNTLFCGTLESAMQAIERGDLQSAAILMEQAACEGDILAQHNLSVMYSNGYGVDKDTDKGSYWLHQATQQRGNEVALTNVYYVQ